MPADPRHACVVAAQFGINGQLQLTEIGQLSDGQKSRLIFALVRMVRPNILLLDEPVHAHPLHARPHNPILMTRTIRVARAIRIRIQIRSPPNR